MRMRLKIAVLLSTFLIGAFIVAMLISRRLAMHGATGEPTGLVGPARSAETNTVVAVTPDRMIIDGLDTVLIPGGTFVMGTKIKKKRDSEYHADEAPLKVTVNTFRIGKFPITAEQMCLFLNSKEAKKHDPADLYLHQDMIAVGSGTRLKYSTITVVNGEYVPRADAAQAPANFVTWKGAVLFCEWLSKKTGKTYRLPAEAEWEFAARGTEGRKFPWSDEDLVYPMSMDIGDRYDYTKAYNSAELDRRAARSLPMWTTTPVGSHPGNATPEGVRDMCSYGIGEWCANTYVAKLTPQEATNTAVSVSDTNTYRIVRGGARRAQSQRKKIRLPYSGGPHGGVAWTRLHEHPLDAPRQSAAYGFRVVEEVAEKNKQAPGRGNAPNAK